MNNQNNEKINKETLFGGITVMVVGMVMAAISLLAGTAGSKLSNFKWRSPKEVKQDGEIEN